MKEEELKVLSCAVIPVFQPLFEYERFGNFNKLLRVATLVLQFVFKMKSKSQNLKQTETVDEIGLTHATKLVLKDVQRANFQSELEELKRDGMVRKQSSLFNLSPWLDEEGFIRLKGRLSQAPDLTYEEKHPLILPKCYVTYLLLKAKHTLLKHAGVETLLSSVRRA